MSGKLIISLDYELMWGVCEKRTIHSYGSSVEKVPEIINRTLDLFNKYRIHATWATVGFLLNESKKSFERNKSEIIPEYQNVKLSSYNYFDLNNEFIGDTQIDDPLHWGCLSIKNILNNPYQELASHTYSHFFCLEKGASLNQFNYDMFKMNEVSKVLKRELSSIVFPRNQYSERHLDVCKKNGFVCYRGTQDSFIWINRSSKNLTFIIRVFRFLDSYLPLSGYNCFNIIRDVKLLNIKASFFFRPYNRRFRIFEFLKMYRLKNAMKYAAVNSKCIHLWWHPHNFGSEMNENFKQLQEILAYYKELNDKYGMESVNMLEAAKE